MSTGLGKGLLVSALLLGVAACGSARGGFDKAFTKRWQSDEGQGVARLYQRLKGADKVRNTNVAVALTGGGFVARSLSDGTTFTHTGQVDTLPQLSGNVLVFSSGPRVIAVDAKDGRNLWSVDALGRRVRGVGDDGKYTVVSLGDAEGNKTSVLLAIARNGNVERRYEVRTTLGTPAVREGVAFVPWESQYVSALDLATGEEVARLLLRHQTSHALRVGEDLYFGQLKLSRFDDKIARSDKQLETRVELPEAKLPGNPRWFRDGSDVLLPEHGAASKIHLFAYPTPDDEVDVAGGTYAAAYFSIAFGLDAKSARLVWVRRFEEDLLGGAASPNGFVFCDAVGALWAVSSDGSKPTSLGTFGANPKACTAWSDSVKVPQAGKESLAQQIEHVLANQEPSLATGYRFVLEQLPQIEDPLITKILIDLIENPRTVPSLVSVAKEQLSKRRNGEQYMLAALERHYDFLAGLQPPPVGPIAQALAAMKSPSAAEALAPHLNDPATAPEDVLQVARALEVLATRAELGELKTFFALYRAAADEDALVGAVVHAARALVRIGDQEALRLVEHASTDPITHPKVRSQLAEALKTTADAPT